MDVIGFLEHILDCGWLLDYGDVENAAVEFGLVDEERRLYLDREGETAVNRLKAILGKFDGKVSDGVLLTGKEAGTLVKVGIVQWLRGVLETECPI